MADLQFNGLPKGVVGKYGRDTTDRPKKLKLKAPKLQAQESTIKRGSSRNK